MLDINLSQASMRHKVNILLIGPKNSGKTKIANFLGDLKYDLPDDFEPTKTLRIVEFDINGIDINGTKCDVDVQLWDTTGNDLYNYYWAVYRQYVDGIVFVYNPEDDTNTKKLDSMYNYFINMSNFSQKLCVLCTLTTEDSNNKNMVLSSPFLKISEIKANLDNQGEKFKQDFIKYVVSVVKTNK